MSLFEDDGDGGVQVADVHFTVTVHIGSTVAGVACTLDSVDNRPDITDVHLVITVYVTRGIVVLDNLKRKNSVFCSHKPCHIIPFGADEARNVDDEFVVYL